MELTVHERVVGNNSSGKGAGTYGSETGGGGVGTYNSERELQTCGSGTMKVLNPKFWKGHWNSVQEGGGEGVGIHSSGNEVGIHSSGKGFGTHSSRKGVVIHSSGKGVVIYSSGMGDWNPQFWKGGLEPKVKERGVGTCNSSKGGWNPQL